MAQDVQAVDIAASSLDQRIHSITSGWRAWLKELQIDPRHVLRRAELPEDLFTREGARLTTHEYFRFWAAVEAEADDPLLPIALPKTAVNIAFNPVLFEVTCSANLNAALRRAGAIKGSFVRRLPGTHAYIDPRTTRIIFEPPAEGIQPSRLLEIACVVLVVEIVRGATREHVIPLRVEMRRPPSPADAYGDFFGVPVTRGPEDSLTFSAVDAERPFLTSLEPFLECFDPQLRRPLTALDDAATIAEKVRSVLFEALPSEHHTVEQIARRVAMSKRSLQRRLHDEGESFQSILADVRRQLAMHYLGATTLSGAEISSLVGFGEANSFYRAFNSWTGQTLEEARAQRRARK